MAPASTGITPISRIAVIAIAHGYKELCNSVLCTRLAYSIVHIRLMAPVKELIPAACSDTRNTSTDIPA